MKKLLSAVTSIVMSVSLMTGAFASSVSAAGSITVTQPNVSMGEVLDVSAKKTASDGSVEWLIPSVVAAPGQTVTLPVIAKNSTLAVAGAQFNIDVAAPIAYKAIVGGDAYTSNIGSNSKGNKFLFNDKSGIEKIAAEGATVFTLSYTVPENCKEGKYDVKWSNANVSDTDGFDITKNVKFTDGVITVDKSAAENTVEWIIPTVTGAPGQTVELPVTVKNSTLPVAGAQFYIDAAAPIAYKAIAGGDAYTSNIGNNPTGTKFMFEDKTGKEKIAAEGSTVFTISYTIPADCAEGTYAVKWSDPNVSDTDGFDITKSVKFTDGAIKVDKDAEANSVEWIIPTVVAAPGQTITMPVIVKNSTLAVAGAQFFIDAASPIKYKSVTGGDAYTSNIGSNDKGNKFLFDEKSGVQKVAPEGSTVFTLAYTVPADCAEGTYAVKWSDANVSDTDGFNITKSVKLIDGAIKVVKDDGEGKIQWVIDKTEAYPGETVTLKAYVSNPDDVALAVAGAQYKINAETPIEYKSMKSGGAYVQNISENTELKKFLFNHNAGTGVVAANNATIMTLSYKVPENCDPGVYSVKWADAFVSDTDGFDLTSRVSFVDGSITVKAPVSDQIKWVIDNVKASRGEKVTLNVVVEDPKSSNLSVAGAQFSIKADSPIKYEEAMSGSAYTANFSANDEKNLYMFRSNSGKGSVAADKSTIMTLTYTVPTDCPNGVYPVKWSDAFVSDTDGFSLTENIIFVDGSISIGDPAEGSVEWVIPTVQGEKGKDVTLVAKVKGTADLPVAGAQFVINDEDAVNYKSATGTPYGAKLEANDDKKIFKFVQNSGKGKSAKDGDELFTLTYSVPADCPDGIYPVSWAKQFVSDEDGFDITPNVKFVDGAIIIGTVTTTSTTTVSTTTTTATTSTTSSTLPTPEGGIKWVIDTVEAYPGQTVKLNIVVDDAKNSALAIAGAQFGITNPAQVVYNAISGSDAYKANISFNNDKQKFLMANKAGSQVAAKDKDIVGVLTYQVPTDCPEGVYPVEFTKGSLEIFDTDGFSLTDKIVGQGGAIIVRKPITSAPYTSSVTTTSTTAKTTAPVSTESTTSVSGKTTESTSAVSTESTTSTSGKTTQSTSAVSTESTTSTSGKTTQSTTPVSTESTTSTSGKTTQSTSAVSTESTTSVSGKTTESTSAVSTESTTSTSGKTTQSTSAVSTKATTISDPSISTSTVTVPKDSIAWEVEKVTAYPGQDVVVKVKVKDPRNTQLAIAGAQFNVNANGEVTLVKAGDKSAYGADIKQNDDTFKFMFASGSGKGRAAADGSVVIELTYKVGENAVPGTVIPVTLDNMFITDEDGFDITKLVLPINGSITVVEPKTTPTNTGSTTTVSTETTSVTTESTSAVSTESETSTSAKTTESTSTVSTESTTSTSAKTTDGTSTVSTESTTSTSAKTTDGTSTVSTESTTSVSGKTTESTSAVSTESTTSVSGKTTESTTSVSGKTTESTSTVSTQTTTVSGPEITSSTVSIPEDGIAWKVDKVTAYPGEEVVVKVKVIDPSNTKLSIAGAQFNVNANGEVTLVKAGDKSAYGADIKQNDEKFQFMFASGSGKGHVAADGSVVIELTYKVGENVKPGTVIPITLDNLFITDEDGFDITDKVAIINGSITVIEPKTTIVTETVTTIDTTTVEITTVETTQKTSIASTESTVSTSAVSTESTSAVSTQSTTKGTDETTSSTSAVSTESTTSTSGKTTESTSAVSTQSTTKGTDETSSTSTTNKTTQKDISITTSTNGTDQHGTDITRTTSTETTSVDTTTSTETTSSNTTSTSTETTTSVTTSNVPGIKSSYAVIETQVGYYFSHDNGKRANGMTGGFNKNQVKTLKIVDVYSDGHEVERDTIDMDLINFNGETPESVYNSRTHVPKVTTIDDFKYDVPVFYGDKALKDKDGNDLTVRAYIGVKGDASLDNMVDAVDASSVLRYYASVSTNDRSVYDVVLQSTKAGLAVSGPTDELDELAAFLADVTENEWGENNWMTKKDGRLIDSNDASKILAFYAKSSSSDYAGVSSYDIWNEVLGSKRFGA